MVELQISAWPVATCDIMSPRTVIPRALWCAKTDLILSIARHIKALHSLHMYTTYISILGQNITKSHSKNKLKTKYCGTSIFELLIFFWILFCVQPAEVASAITIGPFRSAKASPSLTPAACNALRTL